MDEGDNVVIIANNAMLYYLYTNQSRYTPDMGLIEMIYSDDYQKVQDFIDHPPANSVYVVEPLYYLSRWPLEHSPLSYRATCDSLVVYSNKD